MIQVNTHGRPRVLHHFLSMLTRTAEAQTFEPCSERKNDIIMTSSPDTL